jgi:hypothetical protein
MVKILKILGPNQCPYEINQHQGGYGAAKNEIEHQIRSHSSA